MFRVSVAIAKKGDGERLKHEAKREQRRTGKHGEAGDPKGETHDQEEDQGAPGVRVAQPRLQAGPAPAGPVFVSEWQGPNPGAEKGVRK